MPGGHFRNPVIPGMLKSKFDAWPRVGRGVQWLVRVGLVERLTAEAGSDDAGEVGAFEDVFVRAAQRVIDGLAGGLGVGDLVIELGEREPDVAQEQDDADQPDCRFGIAALP
jgi:hypothetical protein